MKYEIPPKNIVRRFALGAYLSADIAIIEIRIITILFLLKKSKPFSKILRSCSPNGWGNRQLQ